MVLTEIITIGDELLIGQVVDTNSAWMGQELNKIGIKVKQITSISDDRSHILKALKEAGERADVILITGGLGPTKDDITKKTLCEYFDCGYKFDAASFEIIERIFKSRGREVTAINRLQAEVPEKCEVLLNQNGTAPGMWFDEGGKIFVSMPGVPNEMKGLMTNEVLPRLKEKFQLAPIVHKTILTQGIGESMLAEMIAEWEDNLPDNLKLAYLPKAGMVRLRITGTGDDEQTLRTQVDRQAAKLLDLIDPYVFGFENETLESILGELLKGRKETVATAESCTGGNIAHRITSIPGSSAYYIGSVVAYANHIKTAELGVDPKLFETVGAVSEEAVKAMAEGIRKKFNTTYGISSSGIAGPDGGSEAKPVGTVWIAVAGPDKTITKLLHLGSGRERIIQEASHHALNQTIKLIKGH